MIDKKQWLSNFRDESQKAKALKILDKISICSKSNKTTYTDFLEPFILAKVINLVKNIDELNFYFWGGYTDSERKRLGICQDYSKINYLDFPITALKIENKTSTLSHRDYLGSLVGLGIDRAKLGDIIVQENSAIVIVAQEIETYIYSNLNKIGKQDISDISYFPIDEIVVSEIKYSEIVSTVSSLRMDSVLSVCFRLSRSSIVDLIKSEKALKNGELVSPSTSVSQGDILSLRGYGKAKLYEIGGTSKKDRIFIKVHTYI